MENYNKIAKNIIANSLKLKQGDKLYISVRGLSQYPLGNCLFETAKRQNLKIKKYFRDNIKFLNFWENASKKDVEEFINWETEIIRNCDGVALLRDNINLKMSDNAIEKYNYYFREVHQKIRFFKKWVLTIVPCLEESIENNVDLQLMTKTYLKSSSINSKKFEQALNPLFDLMNNTDKVHIISSNTDLVFSIKNQQPRKCFGEKNLPDGEICIPPVVNSVNGYITYNVPSKRNGIVYENIYFKFENGKIIEENCNHKELLTKELNIDEGARYIGEFAIGLNPYITKPLNSILYDEKICGSFHFTPGNSCNSNTKGNRSSLHWDLIQIQTKEYGGGEIWFDDVLIIKNGLFVLETLQHLNPKNLKNILDDKKYTN